MTERSGSPRSPIDQTKIIEELTLSDLENTRRLGHNVATSDVIVRIPPVVDGASYSKDPVYETVVLDDGSIVAVEPLVDVVTGRSEESPGTRYVIGKDHADPFGFYVFGYGADGNKFDTVAIQGPVMAKGSATFGRDCRDGYEQNGNTGYPRGTLPDTVSRRAFSISVMPDDGGVPKLIISNKGINGTELTLAGQATESDGAIDKTNRSGKRVAAVLSRLRATRR